MMTGSGLSSISSFLFSRPMPLSGVVGRVHPIVTRQLNPYWKRRLLSCRAWKRLLLTTEASDKLSCCYLCQTSRTYSFSMEKDSAVTMFHASVKAGPLLFRLAERGRTLLKCLEHWLYQISLSTCILDIQILKYREPIHSREKLGMGICQLFSSPQVLEKSGMTYQMDESLLG